MHRVHVASMRFSDPHALKTTAGCPFNDVGGCSSTSGEENFISIFMYVQCYGGYESECYDGYWNTLFTSKVVLHTLAGDMLKWKLPLLPGETAAAPHKAQRHTTCRTHCSSRLKPDCLSKSVACQTLLSKYVAIYHTKQVNYMQKTQTNVSEDYENG